MALGIILAPYGQIPGAYPSEIGYSYGGNGEFSVPYDPFYNTRGEPGFYHDTQLGRLPTPHVNLFGLAVPMQTGLLTRWRMNRARRRAFSGLGRSVPSDFELAPTYGFTPDMDGWTVAREGFQPGSWIPPNGWNPAGAYGPPMAPRSLSGFGDATPATADDLIAALNAHNQKVFTLTLVSTFAVALSAIITTIRNTKLIRQESKLIRKETKLLEE
jgi:hypothetical protein